MRRPEVKDEKVPPPSAKKTLSSREAWVAADATLHTLHASDMAVVRAKSDCRWC